MPRLDGCPQDYAEPKGRFSPIAVTLHRTYGQWGGDYAVIQRGSLCQFLIGKYDGQWVQFMDSTEVAWHCNGANYKAVGIELTGTNDDPLTEWQIARLGDVLRFLQAAHGIPLAYIDPAVTPAQAIWVNGGGFAGVISHVNVRTDNGSSQHSDAISMEDYAKAVLVGTPAPKKKKDKRMYVYNPHNPSQIWCLDGNTRRHVSPDEWAFVQYVGGGDAARISVDWFDSYPAARP